MLDTTQVREHHSAMELTEQIKSARAPRGCALPLRAAVDSAVRWRDGEGRVQPALRSARRQRGAGLPGQLSKNSCRETARSSLFDRSAKGGSSMGGLTNKTALVTGGSSAIGSSKLEIRDAGEAELPAMVNVTKASYAEFQESSPSGFWEVYMTNVEETIMRASDTERIAAFLDGELVASVLLCHKSFKGDDPEIRLLAVLPDFRKHGIARQLMDECERRVGRAGKARVVLHTTHLMSTARRWYERSGYFRFEAIDFSPVPGFLVMGFAKDLKAKKHR